MKVLLAYRGSGPVQIQAGKETLHLLPSQPRKLDEDVVKAIKKGPDAAILDQCLCTELKPGEPSVSAPPEVFASEPKAPTSRRRKTT